MRFDRSTQRDTTVTVLKRKRHAKTVSSVAAHKIIRDGDVASFSIADKVRAIGSRLPEFAFVLIEREHVERDIG
jgi:fructose-1,6-bisphosphatase/sedoheptulose 1,7-bisphosphatase-like protein